MKLSTPKMSTVTIAIIIAVAALVLRATGMYIGRLTRWVSEFAFIAAFVVLLLGNIVKKL